MEDQVTQGRVEEKTKRKGRAKGIPLTSNLPHDERLRVFVNLILDRIKEDQMKVKIKNLEAKDA